MAAYELPVIDKQKTDSRSFVARRCGSCTACCTVLAIIELHKPARWACDHVNCQGCGIYEDRPSSCREFNCAWLRNEIPGDTSRDESLRPDRLGVMFDSFYSTATNKDRFVAFELWHGACDEPRAAALLGEVSASREVDLSYRDGTWRTIGKNGAAEIVV